jgi:hypothetical protein
MKPHPRIRKTIKWGGAAVTVLLVVVWIGSGWWGVIWSHGRVSVGLEMGRANFYYFPNGGLFLDGYQRTHFAQAASNWRYLLGRPFPDWGGSSAPPQRWLSVPLSWFVLASVLSTTITMRLDAKARRRERPHLCPNCHYDRAGLAADAKCPECGNAAP